MRELNKFIEPKLKSNLSEIEIKQPGCNKQLHRLELGTICPYCRKGRIHYNGLLNLECSKCGVTQTGAFT